MSELPKTLLFLDIETTGLKPDAALLELAAILVRAHDLVQISRFQICVRSTDAICDAAVWDPYVVNMHSKNGLLYEVADKGQFSAKEALAEFQTWLTKLGLPAQSCYIAGSSVHTDLAFLKKCDRGPVASVAWEKFSHRLLDISTLRTFDRMIKSRLYPEKKPDERHRAMSDCEQDLEQLRRALTAGRELVNTHPDNIPF